MKTIGTILIITGIVTLVYTGFTYTKEEKIAEIGPLEIEKETEKTVNWPPVLGAVLVLSGIFLILVERKK